MEAVLYHPRFGYYTSDRNPIGKEGADFYTSSDLDPGFGRLVARKLSELAAEFESFTVVELGAGTGALARDILAAHPFTYRILERSAAMRERQRQTLGGFDVEWIDELPAGLTGCVFSNEFFDALPAHRVVRRSGMLREICVGEGFREVECDLKIEIDENDIPIAEGHSTEINLDARQWMARIGACLQRGYHLAIDYGYLRREFYARPSGTVMSYWRHQAVEDPYARIGEQDITTHVNFSDLIDAGAAASLETVSFTSQMQFLIDLGILDEIGRLSAASDADSIRRLQALKKLILPGGMGERFKVLLQRKL
ncbi:MAG TPA: SAM-dependent methyltransferase [Terriglobia bacterium]|nr:SAM-dependent methyltransferase [Terriglobia bacterium]